MISLLMYRILLLLLLPILLIFLLFRSKNNKAYRQRLAERLGYFPSYVKLSDSTIVPVKQGGIVVHAASVGEVIALKTFIEKLLLTYPDLPITVTSFTPTGSAQVTKLFGDRVQHGYLPLDILPCTALFLDRLKPKMMIFMETELWPNLIAQCSKKQIKLLLINGRLSQKSLTSYAKFSSLIQPCLNRFNKILCQSQENLNHFLQLGANSIRCINSGNLKFDISINAQIQSKKVELSQLLSDSAKINLQTKRTLWLVASTHEGDEVIALNAFKILLKKYPELLLVLVPRHPERFDYVAKLCIDKGLSLARRSENTQLNGEQVWLLDSLGELMAAFDLSDIVTMGGSFSDVGGHNPLEPALFNKPIIVGHNMSNFNEIMQQLKQENAIIQLSQGELSTGELSNSEFSKTTLSKTKLSKTKLSKTKLSKTKLSTDKLSAYEPSTQLAAEISRLLQQPAEQKFLGENALKVVLANQGASEKTLDEVKRILPPVSNSVSKPHGES